MNIPVCIAISFAVVRHRKRYDHIQIAEEGYPVYEELLKGYFGNDKFRGRLDGALPRMGELSPDALAKALGVEAEAPRDIPGIVAGRPPMLCDGCGHRDLFEAINRALEVYPQRHVFGDIGCYTLGALPPTIPQYVCGYGAAITLRSGRCGYASAVAVIGDSTFTHQITLDAP